jgi:hypothetical protein
MIAPSSATRREYCLASAAFLALTCALFLPVLDGGVLAERDLALFTLPCRWLALKIWLSGAVPLWNSAAACGSPLLADPNAGALDPFLPFLLIRDLYLGATLSIAFKIFLAGLTMFRFLRLTGLRFQAGLLGGVAYMLSGFSIGSWTLLQWTSALPLLPLLLAVPHSGGRPLGRGTAAAAILTLTFFSGAVESVLLNAAVWIVETLHARGRSWKEILIGLAGTIALSLAVSLPTLELHLLSDRAVGMKAMEALAYSVSPFQTIGHVLPLNFFTATGGPLPQSHVLFPFPYPLFFSTYLGAALLPLVVLGFRGPYRRYVGIGAAALIIAMGAHIPGAERALELFPVLGSLRYPVKILHLAALATAILAAASAERLEATSIAGLRRSFGVVVAVIVAVVAFGIFHDDPKIPLVDESLLIANFTSAFIRGSRHAFFALGIAWLLLEAAPPRIARYLLIVVIAVDLGIAARHTLIFEKRDELGTPVLRGAIAEAWPRLLNVSDAPWRDRSRPNTPEQQEIFEPLSGTAWMARHGQDYGSFRRRAFTAWSIASLHPELWRAEWSSVGARYFAAAPDRESDLVSIGARLVARHKYISLWENPFALPEQRFYAGDQPPVTERRLGPGDTSAISTRRFIDGSIISRFRTSGPGWLYRAENFQSGWRVRDRAGNRYAVSPDPAGGNAGRPGQWVRIPGPGDYELRFEYAPAIFHIGLSASALSALFLVCGLCFLVRGQSSINGAAVPGSGQESGDT